MRKLLTIGLCLAACAASAQSSYERHILSASVGTNPTNPVTGTSLVIRGAVEEIAFSLPTAGATATVSVVSTPEVGPAIVLYTNAALTADARTLPRLDGNGTVSTNSGERVVLVGDTVTFTVTPVSVTTGVVWKAEVKVAR